MCFLYDANTTETEDETQTTESSTYMNIDGEAWKERNDTTYASLLDNYDVPYLFSDNYTQLYIKSKENNKNDELIAYIFSDYEQDIDSDNELVDYIFSKKLEFTKTKDYKKEENNYFAYYVLCGVFIVVLFIYLLIKFNFKRKKRREKYALEINMEN